MPSRTLRAKSNEPFTVRWCNREKKRCRTKWWTTVDWKSMTGSEKKKEEKKTCRQSATSAGPHFRSIVRRTGGYWWPLHNGWEKNERNKSIKRSLQAWKEIRGHSLVDNYFPIVSGPQKVTNTSSGQAKTSWDTQPSLEATACVPSNQLRSFVLSFTFPEWLWGFDHRWNKNKK